MRCVITAKLPRRVVTGSSKAQSPFRIAWSLGSEGEGRLAAETNAASGNIPNATCNHLF
jgi:hypothetical protein